MNHTAMIFLMAVMFLAKTIKRDNKTMSENQTRRNFNIVVLLLLTIIVSISENPSLVLGAKIGSAMTILESIVLVYQDIKQRKKG